MYTETIAKTNKQANGNKHNVKQHKTAQRDKQANETTINEHKRTSNKTKQEMEQRNTNNEHT